MQQGERGQRHDQVQIPVIGDRIETRRTGVLKRGTVYYADALQVLVKWDDGSSSSLRVGRDSYEIVGRGAASDESPRIGTRRTP